MSHKVTFLIVISILLGQLRAQNALPQVVSGKIERIENFQSRYIDSRTIDVWLPDNYSDSSKYAVLYMHDGQMLFDPEQTWNKQAWDIDNVASELISKNKLPNFIVVGIWNNNQTRHQDCFPQTPFEALTQAEKDTVTEQLRRVGKAKEDFLPRSDKYLKFIVKELRPYINKKYSVYTDRENTLIAGSSMGGLISLYALCEYPQIFGGAACLSTHWVGTFSLQNNPVPNSFIQYLDKNLPNPKNHKVYFDCGDKTLDALYPEIQKEVDRLMQQKGFTEHNWITRYFPGEDHSEQSWKKRLDIPLEFLFRQ